MPNHFNSENIETASRYTVAMHLAANEKVGKAAWYVTLAAVATAIYLHSYWPLAVGLVSCVAIYFVIMQSCVRFVKEQTGLPAGLQATFSERYKTDPAFARDVDTMRKSAKNIVGE